MGETDALGARPVEHGGAQRPRLGDEGNPAGLGFDMRKTGVEPDVRHQQSEAAGPQDAQAVRCGRLQHRLLEGLLGVAGTPLQIAAEDNCGARAARAQFGDQARHGDWRRGDDGEIRGLRQVGDVGIAKHPRHSPVLGIDRHDRAGEPALQQVAHDHIADPVRGIGGAENGDGPGLEQAFESAHAHAVSLPLGTNSNCARSWRLLWRPSARPTGAERA